MSPSSLKCHSTQRDAALQDPLDVPEPAAMTVLPAEVQSAEELNLNEMDVIPMSKEESVKVQKCIGITWNSLRPPVSVFDTGDRPNLLHTSLFPIKWPAHICSLHNMSLRSTTNSVVTVIGKVLLFVNLGDQHVRVHFAVLHNFALSLLI